MARVSSVNLSNNDWQAESDLSTLTEAIKIKQDPKRMAAVKKCAAKRKSDLADQMVSVANIADPDSDKDSD